MSLSKSGNKTHDDAVNAAEGTLQSAIAVASTQAIMRTATITFYRAVLASCVTNSLDQGPSIFALQSLRATP
jgi:hypothetical protein